MRYSALLLPLFSACIRQSVLPVWCEVVIAVLLGHAVYKQGKSIMTRSIIAVIAMYVTVAIGIYLPLKMPEIAGIPATGVWSIILLIYAFIASVLPVTTLLQTPGFYQLPPAFNRHGPF